MDSKKIVVVFGPSLKIGGNRSKPELIGVLQNRLGINPLSGDAKLSGSQTCFGSGLSDHKLQLEPKTGSFSQDLAELRRFPEMGRLVVRDPVRQNVLSYEFQYESQSQNRPFQNERLKVCKTALLDFLRKKARFRTLLVHCLESAETPLFVQIIYWGVISAPWLVLKFISLVPQLKPEGRNSRGGAPLNLSKNHRPCAGMQGVSLQTMRQIF